MPVRYYLFYFFLVLCCLPCSVLAVHDDPEIEHDEAWTFTFVLENDLFADTDRHYTNGIKINWISPDLKTYQDSGRLPRWTWPIADSLPFVNEPGLQRNIGFSLGQKIFTPENIETDVLIKDDRPYAGWLYFATAFHNKNVRELDTVEIQLGVIGPAALGREAQNSVHKLRDIPKARGWSNQLKNEPGIGILFERKWRAFQAIHEGTGFGMDAITHFGGGLGNVYDYVNAGGEVRIGWNIPTDFGTSLIRPGGDTNAPADSSDPRFSNKNSFGIYGFTAASGRITAWDIFLDGNTFADSHSVNKEFLVGDIIVGASVLAGSFKISYSQVFRSKEFREQKSGSVFGSLSLSYSY